MQFHSFFKGDQSTSNYYKIKKINQKFNCILLKLIYKKLIIENDRFNQSNISTNEFTMKILNDFVRRGKGKGFVSRVPFEEIFTETQHQQLMDDYNNDNDNDNKKNYEAIQAKQQVC